LDVRGEVLSGACMWVWIFLPFVFVYSDYLFGIAFWGVDGEGRGIDGEIFQLAFW
jgi:hypothetical protein